MNDWRINHNKLKQHHTHWSICHHHHYHSYTVTIFLFWPNLKWMNFLFPLQHYITYNQDSDNNNNNLIVIKKKRLNVVISFLDLYQKYFFLWCKIHTIQCTHTHWERDRPKHYMVFFSDLGTNQAKKKTNENWLKIKKIANWKRERESERKRKENSLEITCDSSFFLFVSKKYGKEKKK